MQNITRTQHDFPPILQRTDVESVMNIEIDDTPAKVWRIVKNFGGENGWLSYDFMIKMKKAEKRGVDSVLVQNEKPVSGGKISFFEIFSEKENFFLKLKFHASHLSAENSFYIEESAPNKCILSNVVRIQFENWTGKVYWSLIKGGDKLIRRKMLKNIKRLAEMNSK